ncbi:centrosomal protein of 44 kDa isoform X2 [Alligator mississippiensis]|uniref:centrosomal protein of 44 kDa isoform X2 n=1 Tax=Alligator mississippiensis TaxID=8496 RepID=UPI0009073406|nr:centrosomal protein of 44 kDa isoform X2 [Alligator mississippiensis]
MATGDLKGSLRKMEQGLRLLNYPRDVDYAGLVKGAPAAFLPIISYSFTSFSTYIAELLVESDVELTAKSDLRFIETIYKAKSQRRKRTRSFKSDPLASCENLLADPIVRTVDSSEAISLRQEAATYSLWPRFSLQNFWIWSISGSSGGCLCRHSSSVTARTNSDCGLPRGEVPATDTFPLQLGRRAAVAGRFLCLLVHFQTRVRNSCPQPKNVTEDNSQIELLKNQLADCQEKLHKLNWMEDKLHILEERLKGKVIIDEKDWNNLLSRVLLLETELLLQSKKSDLSTEFNNIGEEYTSSRNMILVSPDIERKKEMPESLHQSSGYSSQLSTDPSPKATTINYRSLTEISKETTRQRMERISKMIEETSELLKNSSNSS